MRLESGTQYGDMKGTTTADKHDNHDIQQYLRDRDLIKDGDLVVGMEVSSGEVHTRTQEEPLDVTVLVSKAGRDFKTIPDELAETGTVAVQRVETKIPLNEFFGLFKRFSLTLSIRGKLEGEEFNIQE